MKKQTMRASERSDVGERQDLRVSVPKRSARLSRVVFSSGKDNWRTPRQIFDPLHAEFGFTLDVAANKRNTLCDEYMGNALDPSANWSHLGGACWCNPPYSRGRQAKFIEAAALWRWRGVTTVMLIPARTDTKAFHRYIWNKDAHRPRRGVEVRFLPGRIKFVGAKHGAPFPSMIVIFRGEKYPIGGLR